MRSVALDGLFTQLTTINPGVKIGTFDVQTGCKEDVRKSQMTDTRTSFDTALDELAHVQRRKLLVSLLAHNPQDDTPAVVGKPDDESESLDRFVEMKHVHLPKLVEYGFIEWDQEADEVHKGPKFDEILPLLELLDAHEDELPPGWL